MQPGCIYSIRMTSTFASSTHFVSYPIGLTHVLPVDGELLGTGNGVLKSSIWVWILDQTSFSFMARLRNTHVEQGGANTSNPPRFVLSTLVVV